MAATVQRTLELWKQGEKVLIFCHYIATGRALRQHICEAIRKEIRTLASEKTESSGKAADAELERLGRRFFDEQSPLCRVCDEQVSRLLGNHPQLASHREQLMDFVRRYIRTPAFQAPIGSGMTLTTLIAQFFHFQLAKS